jgi:hypothetical protein
MSNKTQLQENNATLEYVIKQLKNMPTTEDCMALIEDLKDSALSMFTATVGVLLSNWNSANGMYTQTIACDGLLSTDAPIVDVYTTDSIDDNELFVEAWNHIIRVVANDGSITLYTDGEIPDVSFSMNIKVVR